MRRLLVLLLLSGCLLAMPGGRAHAQPPAPPGQVPPPFPPPFVAQDIAGRVRVFIDCTGFWGCDSDYFRENLTFVDHVRDRAVADVHVLSATTSRTSAFPETPA